MALGSDPDAVEIRRQGGVRRCVRIESTYRNEATGKAEPASTAGNPGEQHRQRQSENRTSSRSPRDWKSIPTPRSRTSTYRRLRFGDIESAHTGNPSSSLLHRYPPVPSFLPCEPLSSPPREQLDSFTLRCSWHPPGTAGSLSRPSPFRLPSSSPRTSYATTAPHLLTISLYLARLPLANPRRSPGCGYQDGESTLQPTRHSEKAFFLR